MIMSTTIGNSTGSSLILSISKTINCSSKRFTSGRSLGSSQFASPVELLQDGSEVADVELNLLLCHDLRNTFQSKLVIGVEGQFPDFQSAFLFLNVVYLLVYLDKHGVVVEFLLVVLDNLQGTFLFPFAGSFILGKGIERTALAEQQAAGLLPEA